MRTTPLRGAWAVVFCLSLAFLTVVSPRSASTNAGGPLCVESQPQPVLQDSGWQNYGSNFWDHTKFYETASVIKLGASYVMYLRERDNNVQAIYTGTSSDGMNWVMSTSPVLTTGPNGTWDDRTVFSPDVLWNGSELLMYYVGDGTNSFRQIGVAFSSDGLHWTKYAGNPVIQHGPGAYDHRYTRGPSVILDNGTYKMWYTGTAEPNASIPFQTSIAYATSSDGVHWTKYPTNPVFTGFVEATAGASPTAFWPSVVKLNGTYLMAFGDGGANFGYATSNDGTDWSFSNATQILLTLNSWHNGSVIQPSILVDGSRLLLWYSGTQTLANRTAPYVGGIGFATCGALVIPPPVTKTTTTVSSKTVTTTATHTATETTTQTTLSVSSTTATVTTAATQTVTYNPSAPSWQVAEGLAVGAFAALAAAAAVVTVRGRIHRGGSTV